MYRRELEINGTPLSFETGKYAKQADGSVIVRMGESVVLVTACAAASPREGIDFLPLTVDYKEYTYASGRIPGGFFKREGKPTEKEVLTSRMIDRPIRPLFPAGWRYESQIIALVLSADSRYDTDVLAISGASAALALSGIPFRKTLGSVRVGQVDGQFIINPTFEQRKKSRLDLIIAGTKDGLVMVEAGAKEVPEEEMIQALEAGHAAIKRIVDTIDTLAKEAGKTKRTVAKKEYDAAFYREVEEKVMIPLGDAMRIQDKLENYGTVDQVLANFVGSIPEGEVQRKVEAKAIFKELKEKVLRDEILERRVRLDGRKFDEIRPIWSEVGVLPRVHGSSVFTRGETQALVTVTLGTSDDQQKIETVEGEVYRRFMLHYNFPPFSVGEVQFMRGPGRREIGHGALAERALLPVLPAEEVFPYTIRVVSDILESNGSSSMASVCGGTLSMMDAGVPLRAPVAGVAMGLIMDEKTGKYAVLSDIAGAEDHYGDMDFKVTGTSVGITALQMDIKVAGITAADHARGARTGPARAHAHPRRNAEDARRPARQHLDLRAAHHHHQDSGRQDPRRHRTGRQDDSQHHRAHRREDRRRGRWQRERRVGGRSGRAESHRHHPGADGDGRAEQDLHGQGAAHHRFRRVRRDHARHRRPAARVGDREPSREGRARRAEGRRTGDGEGHQHRPHRQDSPEPQGTAAGRRRRRGRPSSRCALPQIGVNCT